MAEGTTEGEEDIPKKSGKGGLLIGLVLSLIAGGGAFGFTSGMLGGGGQTEAKVVELSNDLAFVPIEPMTVALGKPSERRYLRFRAELEVDKTYQSDIQNLMPRVVDVLNTYLQSLSLIHI